MKRSDLRFLLDEVSSGIICSEEQKILYINPIIRQILSSEVDSTMFFPVFSSLIKVEFLPTVLDEEYSASRVILANGKEYNLKKIEDNKRNYWVFNPVISKGKYSNYDNFLIDATTSLTSINGFARKMLKDTSENDERQKFIQIIVNESRKLIKNLSEVHEKSDVSSMKFSLFSTSSLFNEIIMMIGNSYPDCKLMQSIDSEDNYLKLNFNTLITLILKLIEIVYHVDKDNTISLSSRKNDSEVQLIITVRGLILSKDEKDRFFDSDYTLFRNNKPASEHSIYLSDIRKSIEMMQGEILIKLSKDSTDFIIGFNEKKIKKYCLFSYFKYFLTETFKYGIIFAYFKIKNDPVYRGINTGES